MAWSFARALTALSASVVALAVACGNDDVSIPDPVEEEESDAGSDAPPVQADSASDASAADASDGASNDAGVDADAAPPLDLFDPDAIPVIELELEPAAIAVLSNPSMAPADQKKWTKGTFKHDGAVVADVGIRRKGSSTFRSLPQKAALKIRFDRNVPGQRYAELTDLTLNNMVSDATFLAERLGYQAFRAAGFPAQRANTVHLYINGEDYGIYANVETPNRDFLNRIHAAGGPNGKTLFEANGGGQWLPGVEDNFEMDVGEDADEVDLAALFTKVGSAQPATLLTDVAPNLDTDKWLAFSAFEGLIGQADGYGYGRWGSHNYYMLGDATAKFTLLPWSLDLSLSDSNGVVNVAEPQGGDTLLVRCAAAPACWDAFKAKAAALIADYQGMNLRALAQTWNAQIDALVRTDPKREATIDAYEGETAKLYTWLVNRPGLVKTQLGLP